MTDDETKYQEARDALLKAVVSKLKAIGLYEAGYQVSVRPGGLFVESYALGEATLLMTRDGQPDQVITSEGINDLRCRMLAEAGL